MFCCNWKYARTHNRVRSRPVSYLIVSFVYVYLSYTQYHDGPNTCTSKSTIPSLIIKACSTIWPIELHVYHSWRYKQYLCIQNWCTWKWAYRLSHYFWLAIYMFYWNHKLENLRLCNPSGFTQKIPWQLSYSSHNNFDKHHHKYTTLVNARPTHGDSRLPIL